MKILQINAIYEKFSTGRTTKEMHEYFINHGIESFVAVPKLNSRLDSHFYQIGNEFDHKIHSLLSHIVGLQGYFSYGSTKRLVRFINQIKPTAIILRNLHSNYININLLLHALSQYNIPVILVLHDCWFYTGRCVYYTENNCEKWKVLCHNCSSKNGNRTFFFDFSKKIFIDKRRLFTGIQKLGVVGVSKWVSQDASISLLKGAKKITYIYNWIDLDLFRPHNAMQLESNPLYKDKFVILGVAMEWTNAKGLDIFNHLSSLIPDDMIMICIGRKTTESINKSNLFFLNTTNNTAELADYYSFADVFLNPSIQETFGKTTAEALSAGTPVVAYNSTATPELLGTDNRCGVLVTEHTAQAYLTAIMEVKGKGKAFYSRNCRCRAEAIFNKDTNIKQYLELINEINK